MRSVTTPRVLAALLGGAAVTTGLLVGPLGANAASDTTAPTTAPTSAAADATDGQGDAELAANPFQAFDATVALEGCSGAIVRFPGAQDSDKALILTNGHCTQPMPKPNTYAYNKSVNARATMLKGNVATQNGTLTMDRLLYATMTGTDIGIYRTTTTYAQLKARGVTPRTMATTHPKQGTQISIPSGYWKKNYTCTMDESIYQINEGGYVFKDSFRHSCNTIHGTSGSPVIDQATGVVIAINNTGNDDGERCTLNNPCEVDKNGKITVRKGQNYGQQTYHIITCFENGAINLSKAGCQLYGATNPSPMPTETPTETPTDEPTSTPTDTPTETPTETPTTSTPTTVPTEADPWGDWDGTVTPMPMPRA